VHQRSSRVTNDYYENGEAMKIKLITGLLASIAVLAAGIAGSAEVVPPPYLRVLITAEKVPTKLEVGRVYAVHIVRLSQRGDSYAGIIVDDKGNTVYSGLPVRVECKDPSRLWSEPADGVVQPVPLPNGETGADIDITSFDDKEGSDDKKSSNDNESSDDKEEDCHVHLLAPVDPWMPSGDK
jgi:hypothetical protein